MLGLKDFYIIVFKSTLRKNKTNLSHPLVSHTCYTLHSVYWFAEHGVGVLILAFATKIQKKERKTTTPTRKLPLRRRRMAKETKT